MHFPESMKPNLEPVPNTETGKVGWALAWLLGIPLPVLLVAYLVSRGC